MDDIDRAKALAALEQLEAEKERRLQAKIDAGDLVLVETTVVVYRDESIEDATARAIAATPSLMMGAITANSSTSAQASPRATRTSGRQQFKRLPQRGIVHPC